MAPQPFRHAVPAAEQGRAGTSTALPSDITAQATRRLGAFAALIGALAMAWLLLGLASGDTEFMALVRLGTLALICMSSAALAWIARTMPLPAWLAWWVGLAYMVPVGLLLSVQRHVMTYDQLHGWSACAMLAIVFPVLVPCSPRRAGAAAASLLATSVLGWLLTRLGGMPMDLGTEALRVFMGEITAVPVAVFVSSVVYGLGRELRKARQLGAYELEEVLGQGGMGEVWRARHSMLARPAAIKLIRGPMLQGVSAEGQQLLLRRFEREAQATAALTCPHTVQVFDYGIAPDGTFYYVMELLDGLDLHALVAHYGPVPPARAVFILRQACLSLAEAHRAGMVHRDIKPANMVVCRLGTQSDFLKLLDFGLVTPTTLEPSDARMTTVGDITGTPAFMAPEQARGQIDLDGRCDIYALGCVAYWLLSGQLLFEGSPMEMVASHIKEEPRPLSIATLDPIPPALEALVMRCLAKEPDQRPPSALDVLNALDALGLEEGWSEAQALAWWQHHVGSRAPGNDPAESVALPSQ